MFIHDVVVIVPPLLSEVFDVDPKPAVQQPYIYIYTYTHMICIYIYMVKLKIGPMFALFKGKNWSNFLFFFESLILPAERRGFLKNKQKQQKTHTF